MLEEVLEKYKAKLLSLKGVTCVGIGEKIKGGKPTGRLAIVVGVEKKKPLNALAKEEIVPTSLDGIETDVQELGPFYALGYPELFGLKEIPEAEEDHRKKYRPTPAGVSCGAYIERATGTITANFLVDKKDGKRLTGSCNHVYANVNQYKPGKRLMQPGYVDGGGVGDDFATLKRFYPIDFSKANKIDFAVGDADEGAVSSEILGVGVPVGVQRVETEHVGKYVVKSGRTTGVRFGRISQVNAYVYVNYPQGTAIFYDQILIGTTEAKKIGEPGDSGSTVCLTEEFNTLPKKPIWIGVLFAGTIDGTVAICNQAVNCLELLDLEFKPEIPAPPEKKYAPSEAELIYEVVPIAMNASEIAASTDKDKYSEGETVLVKGVLRDKNTKQGLANRTLTWTDEVATETFSGMHVWKFFSFKASLPYSTYGWFMQTSGEVTTKADGTFEFSLAAKGVGKHRIRVVFLGDK